MHAFVHTFADVPEGSNQLKQAVISYDIHGRAQTTVIDLQSGYATLIGDLIQVTLAKIQWSACKDDFFLKHGHLQLVSCKSLTEQGIDSRTILTLRPKALRSPLEGKDKVNMFRWHSRSSYETAKITSSWASFISKFEIFPERPSPRTARFWGRGEHRFQFFVSDLRRGRLRYREGGM